MMKHGAKQVVMMKKPDVALPLNLAVVPSAEGQQISAFYPEKGHGVSTYCFLKSIQEWQKTLPEIYAPIRPEVEDEAKRQNIEQPPILIPEPKQLLGQFQLVTR